jgi:hypothetical protein
MAQVNALSLGGIGSPCCCGGGCTTTICVRNGCVSSGGIVFLPGVFVQISSGSTVISGGTTGSNGCVTLSIPSADTYTVHYQIPGGSLFNEGSEALTCGGTKTIIEEDTVDFVCCGSSAGACPIPRAMTLTDANGSYAFDFNTTTDLWQCCATSGSLTIMTMNGDQNLCGCTGTTTGTIPILYSGSCVVVDGVGMFQVSRQWAGVGCSGNDGTSTNPPFFYIPISFINLSPLTPCPGNDNANTCTLSDNPGNPFQDTTGSTQVWSECPFTWSGVLTGPTSTPDPVGGTVVISA